MHLRTSPVHVIALILAAGLLPVRYAGAQPLTPEFTYQGELKNAGAPATGLHDLRFRLYDSLSGGTQQGPTLCADNIAVAAGRFTVLLDFGAQFTGQQRFLETEVRQDAGIDCSNIAGFTILGPRQELTATPNAVFALTSASATTAATATNATQLNGQAATFYTNAANFTGTLPGGLLSGAYSSTVNISNPANVFAGSGAALVNLNASNLATGTVADARLSANVPRLNAANAFGSSPNSFLGRIGVGTTTPSVPVHVVSDLDAVMVLQDSGPNSTQAGYVSFWNSTPTETAWVGYGSPGSPHFSVVNARSGGDVALHSGTNGSIRLSTNVTALTVTPAGNVSMSPTSLGGRLDVQGSNKAVAAYGGFIGVIGVGTGSGSYGVVGEIDGSGTAIHASGTFTASGSKAFRIDHPTDPENKYLLHYCTESPEPQNSYNGIVTLDDRGGATVTLPSYFALINTDPRYSLTALGAPMPLLHIGAEIDATVLAAGNAAEPGESAPVCSFRIAGGAAGGRVSWRIDALRNDRWVRQHGAPVEVEKVAPERGTYQHPELFGQPTEKRLMLGTQSKAAIP
jgi:hypothetical protein